MHCFLFLRWITFCSDCRRQVFFYLVDKKSDRVRQVVVLYSKDYMGVGLGGLRIGRLKRVVVL